MIRRDPPARGQTGGTPPEAWRYGLPAPPPEADSEAEQSRARAAFPAVADPPPADQLPPHVLAFLALPFVLATLRRAVVDAVTELDHPEAAPAVYNEALLALGRTLAAGVVYDERSRFPAFLYRLCANAVRTARNRELHRPRRRLAGLMDRLRRRRWVPTGLAVLDEEEGADEGHRRRVWAAVIDIARTHLTALQFNALLAECNGETGKDVATRLGCAEGTVSKAKKKALAVIREKLIEAGFDAPAPWE